MLFITYALMPLISVHAEIYNGTRCQNFVLSLHLDTQILCMQVAKALACLCICTNSPKPLLLDDDIS